MQRQVKVRRIQPSAIDHTRTEAMQETLNARVEFYSDNPDGRTHHRINQYTLHEEIGRGSYAAVHAATDQYGNEYVSCLGYHLGLIESSSY
jgi:hypothetical protein